MGEPEISVVIPTFRRPSWLPELVDRLKAQTLSPDRFEVLFVDNGSGDDTLAVLAELATGAPFTMRVLEHTATQGPAGARNAGWLAARASYVACTDDDCFPEPGWLEHGLAALRADDRVGVVQGRTEPPPGASLGAWTVWRQIHGETPYFEGCNLFFRKDALAATGGFDEVSSFYFEDTAAGWAVVEAGWRRGYADGALVFHPVERRGFRWHIRNGYVERNMVRVAKHHAGFRATFWRPWAYQRDTVLLDLAALGLLVSARRRSALLLLLPYAAHCLRVCGWHPRLVAERVVVDAARAAGHVVGSIENRTVVL